MLELLNISNLNVGDFDTTTVRDGLCSFPTLAVEEGKVPAHSNLFAGVVSAIYVTHLGA